MNRDTDFSVTSRETPGGAGEALTFISKFALGNVKA